MRCKLNVVILWESLWCVRWLHLSGTSEKWYRKVCKWTAPRVMPRLRREWENVQKVHDILLKPLNRVCECEKKAHTQTHITRPERQTGWKEKWREIDTLFVVRQMCNENKKKTSIRWLYGWSASRKSWNVQCRSASWWRWWDGGWLKSVHTRFNAHTLPLHFHEWKDKQLWEKKCTQSLAVYRNFRTLQKHMLAHRCVCWIELSWIAFGVQGCRFFFFVSFFIGYLACLFSALFAIVQALVDMLLATTTRFFPSEMHGIRYLISFGLVFCLQKVEFRTTSIPGR